MSSFQDVRGAMAKLTSDALTAGGASWGVPFVDQSFDNVEESPAKDATGRYAVINISFPQVVTETIGCEGADLIVGSCNVLLYTPKREGMLSAENAMQAVVKEWVRVNKAGVMLTGVSSLTKVRLATRNINGPNTLGGGTIEETRRPHQVTQLSCAFTARVD